MTAPLRQTRFRIGGMDCASCAAKIDTAVRRLDGVADVSVSVTGASMTVSHGGALPEDKVLQQVARLGYGIVKAQAKIDGRASLARAHDHPDHDYDGHDHEGHDHGGEPAGKRAEGSTHLRNDGEPGQAWWRTRRAVLTLACAAALVAAYSIGHLFPAAERWVFLAALLVGLVPIARRALMAALAGTLFSIEMLMTIAAVGAVMIGATEEAAAVVVLFLIGELLEGVAAGRARAVSKVLLIWCRRRHLSSGPAAWPSSAENLGGDVIVVRRAIGPPMARSSRAEDIDEAPVTGERRRGARGRGNCLRRHDRTDGVLKRVTAVVRQHHRPGRAVEERRRPRRDRAPSTASRTIHHRLEGVGACGRCRARRRR